MSAPAPHIETKTIRHATDLPFELGRHVEHDARSIQFAVAGWPWSAIRDVRWERRSPVLDQGRVGSCTGNAAAGWAATDNVVRLGRDDITESTALELYAAATRLDRIPGEYPEEDTGSTGIAVAKALRQAGRCVGYRHAFSLRAALTALQKGPIMLGLPWHEGMFDPTSGGRVLVSGALAGGHEILADQLDGDRVWFTNSWGDGWGVGGRAWFSRDDLAALLRDQGDVTVPLP